MTKKKQAAKKSAGKRVSSRPPQEFVDLVREEAEEAAAAEMGPVDVVSLDEPVPESDPPAVPDSEPEPPAEGPAPDPESEGEPPEAPDPEPEPEPPPVIKASSSKKGEPAPEDVDCYYETQGGRVFKLKKSAKAKYGGRRKVILPRL